MQNQTEIYYRGYQKQYGSQRTHLLWLTDDIEYAKEYGDTVEEYILDASKLKCASLYKMDEFSEEGEIDYLDGPTKEEARLALKAGYNCYAFEANSYSSDCLCLWDKSPIISQRVLNGAEVKELIEKRQMNESKKKKKIIRNDEGQIVPEHCSCGGKIGIFIEGEPIYKCTACGKYYGTMPFHLKENKMKKLVLKESELKEMISNAIANVINEALDGMILHYFSRTQGNNTIPVNSVADALRIANGAEYFDVTKGFNSSEVSNLLVWGGKGGYFYNMLMNPNTPDDIKRVILSKQKQEKTVETIYDF